MTNSFRIWNHPILELETINIFWCAPNPMFMSSSDFIPSIPIWCSRTIAELPGPVHFFPTGLEGFLLKLQNAANVSNDQHKPLHCEALQHTSALHMLLCHCLEHHMCSLRIWRTYHQDEQYMVKCEKIRAFDPCPVFDVSSKHIKSIQIPVAGFESGPPF